MSNRFSTIKLDNYKPLRDLVFAAIREAIISGRLKPGKDSWKFNWQKKWEFPEPLCGKLYETELEGLVVMVPRKGAYVRDLL